MKALGQDEVCVSWRLGARVALGFVERGARCLKQKAVGLDAHMAPESM